MQKRAFNCAVILIGALSLLMAPARAQQIQTSNRDHQTVNSEHGMIGLGDEKAKSHTQHPDAQ